MKPTAKKPTLRPLTEHCYNSGCANLVKESPHLCEACQRALDQPVTPPPRRR